jgi:glycosyltransferase involved in cell wall biosynthesis
LPIGTESIPTVRLSLPAGITSVPAGRMFMPAGIIYLPTVRSPIPGGKVSILAGIINKSVLYYMTKTNKNKFAVIIPVFNHEEMIASVVKKALKLKFPVFVIDDGSTDATFRNIKNIKGIKILRHVENQGKGAAILTGMKEASKIAEWAISIDADGQHDPEDALSMIKSIQPGTRPLVIGMRKDMIGDDVPWTSRFGRGFSNFWVWLSGGPPVKDSQSGFRIYPLPEALGLNVRSRRYQFEVEILAKAKWKGIPVQEVPISVCYTPGTKRISHFRPFIDFVRNSRVFARLIVHRIFVPGFVRRK